MSRTPVPEAKMIETDGGLVPDRDDGWFVVNVADARGIGSGDGAYAFPFEGTRRAFPHFGINITVLGPGERGSMYHAEDGQEAFLVLEGECVLVVEETERRLRRWDFVHSPPDTAHVLVGAGDGPCAILMVGARNAGDGVVYLASEAAAAHGAAVAEDTSDGARAYEGCPQLRPGRFPWPVG